MSRRFDIQTAQDTVVSRGLAQSFITVSNKTAPRYNTSTGVPNNGVAGFATSCIVLNPYGSPGSLVFVNQGTATSSTFLAIA